jgi:hypothetical protein
MKNLIRLVLIGFCFISVSLAQKVIVTGDKLISYDGGFEVTLPSGFSAIQKEISGEGEGDNQKMIMFTSSAEIGACLISFNQYNAAIFDSKTVDEMLKGAIEGYLKDGSKLISSKDVTLNGFQGKSVKFESTGKDGNFFNRFDCYIVRPYMLQVAFVGYKKEDIDKKEIQDYFKSFYIFNVNKLGAGSYLKSDDGEFQIKLPKGYENPAKSETPVKTDAGDISMTMYIKESLTGMAMLAHNDYPDHVFDKKTNDKMLEDAMDGCVNSQKSTVISKSNLYHEDMPGLTFTATSKIGNTTIYTRYDYCIKKPRLYQIAYTAYKKADLEKKEVLDYFRSFKIFTK